MDNEFLQQLEKWFTSYCISFSGDDAEAQKNYALKELHTRKVRENMKALALSLGLADGRLATAEAIGLLHDVGRFEQFRRFRTFLDRESVNHAALGVEVIREHQLLAGLAEVDAATIIHAVRLHNVFAVPPGLTDDQRLFLNLIRDADKLDIWRVFVEYFALPEDERPSAAGLGFHDEPRCSPMVLASLVSEEMVNLTMVNTLNDFKLLQLSWVFDLNFPHSSVLAVAQGNLARLAETLPRSAGLDRALDAVWQRLAAVRVG